MRHPRGWSFARFSITTKLVLIVLVFVTIILSQLALVRLVMQVNSGMRAYIFAEGLWSKGQKDAVYYLGRYAVSQDPQDYEKYLRALAVPLGDHVARIELEKRDYDYGVAERGFVAGGNHPEDIWYMIFLFRRFGWVSYLETSIGYWTDGDVYIEALQEKGEELHDAIAAGRLTPDVQARLVAEIEAINARVTPIEQGFSLSLAEGDRVLRTLLLQLMVGATVLLLGLGLGVSLLIARRLRERVIRLRAGALRVARGDFTTDIPVESGDEIADLASAFSTMATQRMKAEEQLKKARDDALQASRAKSEFLASMSHEIRTPMNSIVGLTDVLADTALTEEQRGYVQRITSAGNTLLTLISDILDLSRIESGHVELEKVVFDVREVVKNVLEVFEEGARERGLTVHWSVAPEVPPRIVGDPGRFRQIVVNLVGNAIKFTEKGRVEVRIEIDEDPTQLLVSVSDTGIGIAAEKIGTMFDSFTQADSSTTRKYGGTGLGLAICRRLVDLMEGRIWAESALGVGSTFHFTVRFERAPEAPLVAAPPPSPSQPTPTSSDSNGHLRILLAEDSEDNRMLIQVYFRTTRDEIDVAENGEIAVEKFKEGRYDVVLMDMQMPVMDGYTATRAIRAWERTHGLEPVPIIALTAYALKEDCEKSLRAGCTAYLTKPVKRAALLDAVSAWGRHGGPEGPAPEATRHMDTPR